MNKIIIASVAGVAIAQGIKYYYERLIKQLGDKVERVLADNNENKSECGIDCAIVIRETNELKPQIYRNINGYDYMTENNIIGLEVYKADNDKKTIERILRNGSYIVCIGNNYYNLGTDIKNVVNNIRNIYSIPIKICTYTTYVCGGTIVICGSISAICFGIKLYNNILAYKKGVDTAIKNIDIVSSKANIIIRDVDKLSRNMSELKSKLSDICENISNMSWRVRELWRKS